MSTRTEGQSAGQTSPAKRTRRRANGHGKRTAGRSRRRQVPSASELEKVIRQLEERVQALTDGRNIRSTIAGATGQVGHVVARASDQMGEMVADTLTDVASHLRSGATSVTGAARLGTTAMQKIGSELERRPLMTVVIALGIGFLAGMTGRREAA